MDDRRMDKSIQPIRSAGTLKFLLTTNSANAHFICLNSDQAWSCLVIHPCPSLQVAKDQLIAIINDDGEGPQHFCPSQGLFATDEQHGIFNGKLCAKATGNVVQTIIPAYKEMGHGSSHCGSMLFDKDEIERVHQLGLVEFGISHFESRARGFFMQFLNEGTVCNYKRTDGHRHWV